MTIRGSCHCKATVFELAAVPAEVTRCTCSICSKRGGLWAYYAPAEVRFVSDDARATYQWGARIGKHNFCSVCGCTTYTEAPDFSTGDADYANPKITINARLLDDVDVESIPVTVIDGKNLW